MHTLRSATAHHKLAICIQSVTMRIQMPLNKWCDVRPSASVLRKINDTSGTTEVITYDQQSQRIACVVWRMCATIVDTQTGAHAAPYAHLIGAVGTRFCAPTSSTSPSTLSTHPTWLTHATTTSAAYVAGRECRLHNAFGPTATHITLECSPPSAH